jgi:hypothetical protein
MNDKVRNFFRDLRNGPYAWPGGYPVSFCMSDGGVLCFKCAKENAALIGRQTRDARMDGWAVECGFVKWENDPDGGPETCDNCYEDIEVAYPAD